MNGQSDDMTAKEKLLLWSQRMVEGYQGLRCDNFTSSWRDGKLFNAIIHKHRCDTVPLHDMTNTKPCSSNNDRDYPVKEQLKDISFLMQCFFFILILS